MSGYYNINVWIMFEFQAGNDDPLLMAVVLIKCP